MNFNIKEFNIDTIGSDTKPKTNLLPSAPPKPSSNDLI